MNKQQIETAKIEALKEIIISCGDGLIALPDQEEMIKKLAKSINAAFDTLGDAQNKDLNKKDNTGDIAMQIARAAAIAYGESQYKTSLACAGIDVQRNGFNIHISGTRDEPEPLRGKAPGSLTASVLMIPGSGMTLSAMALAKGLRGWGSACLVVPTESEAARLRGHIYMVPAGIEVVAASNLNQMNREMRRSVLVFDNAQRCADVWRQHGQGELLDCINAVTSPVPASVTRAYLFQYA